MTTGLSDAFNIAEQTPFETLMEAIQLGDKASVIESLHAGADVNQKNQEGFTPLIWAVFERNLELTSFLIDKGARIDESNNNGVTALIMSAGNGEVEIAQLLIDKGADLDKKTWLQTTALDAAHEGEFTEIVEILQKAHAAAAIVRAAAELSRVEAEKAHNCHRLSSARQDRLNEIALKMKNPGSPS